MLVDAARPRDAIGDANVRRLRFERPPQRALADHDEPHGAIGVRQRADDQIDALDRFQPADRQDVVAERSRSQFTGQRRRMVQRFGGQTVVPGEPRRRVAGVAEEARRPVGR